MRFQVPQFIEVEDKIFGPLTLRQFIYLAAGASATFIFYRFLPLFIAIFFILPTIVFSLALAFYKINNKPFVFVLEAFFKYMMHPRLYIWQKVEKKVAQKKAEAVEAQRSPIFVPRLSESKLKELTWSLDIHEAPNPVTHDK